MRVWLVLLAMAALCRAQPLPAWIGSLLPHNNVPAVQKADKLLAELAGPHRTGVEYAFTEAEVNAYLVELWHANPGSGFSDPLVTLLPKNFVRGVFDLDLKKFLAWRPQWQGRLGRFLRLFPTPQLKVALQVRFETEQRRLKIQIVDARLNGHYVAPQLLNLGLTFLRHWKEGRVNVVDGMPLPWGLHHIVTTQGGIRLGA
jgi:hypothetical protein